MRVTKANGSQATDMQRDAPTRCRLFKMTAAKLRVAMGRPETRGGDLCQVLGITQQTLYRHISPKRDLRPDEMQ